ncbi:MAG TPA: DUF5063 domain-containing protein [Beutenbergiaceae bacterium]|nr:DUF5063 domain-containing protein [Beutenbergiaceae bacterium]
MSQTPEPDSDLRVLGTAMAGASEQFLQTTREVAAGATPESAIALLLLAVSEISAAGSRLGAIEDIVPATRFEPDAGPEADIEPLRLSLANVLEGVDAYSEVPDPLIAIETSKASLSDDLADVAANLAVGLQHHRAGHFAEALWWWQFSYLSVWGERAASAGRVLISLIGHMRLDVEDDVAADAEYDALHAVDRDTVPVTQARTQTRGAQGAPPAGEDQEGPVAGPGAHGPGVEDDDAGPADR